MAKFDWIRQQPDVDYGRIRDDRYGKGLNTITREQLDAFKSSRVCKVNSDQEAVDYLINIAENAFNQAVQAAEYIADLQTGGDPYEVVHSK